MKLRRYWTTACLACPIKSQCTTGKERRITRWEHEHVLEAVQRRLDENPKAMRQRRETVEHPFGTIKARMGATHFLMKTLPKRRLRDGAARARLQSDPRDEHHRHQAADRGDQGIGMRIPMPFPRSHRHLEPSTAHQGRTGTTNTKNTLKITTHRQSSAPEIEKVAAPRYRATKTQSGTRPPGRALPQHPQLPT